MSQHSNSGCAQSPLPTSSINFYVRCPPIQSLDNDRRTGKIIRLGFADVALERRSISEVEKKD